MSVIRHIPPSSEEIFGGVRNMPNEIDVGLLQMQILWMLSRKPSHGYELMKNLSLLKKTKITQGTLYPAIKKLQRLGLIEGKYSERRIIYKTTPKGLKVMKDACFDFTRTFFGVFQDFVCHKCVQTT